MRKIYFIASLFVSIIGASAQLPEAPTSVLSPNAASLGLYGEIPVSHFTGTPEISIPLYDIKLKGFTLPISLNYHASVVHVDQRAGWTGLGWTLFAGGAITRIVNDVADEYNNPNSYSRQPYPFVHFYDEKGRLHAVRASQLLNMGKRRF